MTAPSGSFHPAQQPHWAELGMRFARFFVRQHAFRLSAFLPKVYWMIRRPVSRRYGTRVPAGFIQGEMSIGRP